MNRVPSKPPVYFDEVIRAPEGGQCLICGQPLGAEQHFITALPDGVHVACRDKKRPRRIPFPGEESLASLRRLAVLFQRQYRQIVEVGRWFASIQRGWPGTKDAFEMDCSEKLERFQAGLTVLGEEIDELGQKIRMAKESKGRDR